MNERDILFALMKYKGTKSKTAFANFLGVSVQVVTNWLNRQTFNFDVIADHFPEVNEYWLRKGEGAMLKENYSPNDDDSINLDSRKTAPIVPVEIAKDPTISIWEFMAENMSKMKIIEPSQLLPFFDIIFRVQESNMNPSIEKGDILFLQHTKIENIINGMPYVIDTNTNGLLIYNLTKKDNDVVICESTNEDYNTIEINVSQITDVYNIVGIFAYNIQKFNEANILRSILKQREETISTLTKQYFTLIEEMQRRGRHCDDLMAIIKKNNIL